MGLLNVKVTDSGEIDTDEPSWVVPPIGGLDELSQRTKEFRKRNSKEMRKRRKKLLKKAIKELKRRTEEAAFGTESPDGGQVAQDSDPGTNASSSEDTP